MVLAFSYIRFSSKKQELGDSLRRQNSALERVLANHPDWTLDKRNYRDLGVSGWTGENVDEGALGAFLRAVKAGSIPTGSILIVEKLDRMSRQKPRKVLRLIEDILDAGILVATCDPERIYDEKSLDETLTLMEIIFFASRAHEESTTKSQRVSQAWQQKIERAKKTGELITERVPDWLKWNGKKFAVIPARKRVVQRIFRYFVQYGIGPRAICKRLNGERIPSFSGKEWGSAYVRNILTDGKANGTFTSTKYGTIPNYYPKIIDDATQAKVLSDTEKRRRFPGVPGRTVACLFTGIAFDVATDSTMVYIQKDSSRPGRWTPSAYERGHAKGTVTFLYEVFETYFLKFVSDVRLDEVSPEFADVSKLSGELAAIERKISTTEKFINSTDADITPHLEILKRLEKQRKGIAAEIESARAANPQLMHARSLIEQMRQAKGKELADFRLRLRAAIREVVRRIDVSLERDGWHTRLLASITLASGIVRKIAIATRRGQVVAVSYKPPKSGETTGDLLANGTRVSAVG